MNRTLITLLAIGALTMPLHSAPTVPLKTGATVVTPSEAFTGALTTLGVAVQPLQGKQLRFPIIAGAADLATARAEIVHSNGIALSAGETRVELSNFVIDTTATPVLTGLVVANGSVVGRVPLFKVGLPAGIELPLAPAKGKLVLAGTTLTLTADAAAALNGAFGVSAFVEDFPIGSATVTANGVRVPR
jgi:hypothetical protein